MSALTQSKEGKNRQNHDDQTDQVDETVHGTPPFAIGVKRGEHEQSSRPETAKDDFKALLPGLFRRLREGALTRPAALVGNRARRFYPLRVSGTVGPRRAFLSTGELLEESRV